MKLSSIGKWLLTILSVMIILVPGRGANDKLAPDPVVSAATTSSTKAPPLTPAANSGKSKSTGASSSGSNASTGGDIKNTGNTATQSENNRPSIPVLALGAKGQAALWLNETLAALQYLPLGFTPSAEVSEDASSESTSSGPSPAIANTLAATLQDATLKPIPGTWSWKAKYPTSLTNLWNANAVSVITEGAIIRFEHDHGLDIDGIAGPQVDNALLIALTKGQIENKPYTYVTVSKTDQEHLDIWQNGSHIYNTLVNTGISACPTPNGTWPVFLRLTSQTMRGKSPSGEPYNDPGVPWINYFYKGCAIHGYVRPTYGSPQSLGCVELPVSNAQKVYSLLDYGTLVTVGS
ncbi:L,D-transpeptidase family protein [Alicyclobacillus dauci]|uniref:L,D-transpeptidase family protein n=1 Tax=Alicyclobacillus dauci TaxID=1475485 RepID=A0ABY6Z263_9BACL|nr:L,D-transpeptidase family protein [Alicyclobacillus dauci]WAH36932.1 L,D-transpeptidase family protein [Alicyclobacillus dauci]